MQTPRQSAALIIAPGFYLLLFFALPMLVMLAYSFRSTTGGAGHDVFTLAHYRSFLANANFQRLLLRSVSISAAISILATLLAYPLAYCLAFESGPSKVMLLTLIIVPTWSSYLLRVFAWKLVLGSNGLLNSLLLWLGAIKAAAPILIYSRSAVIVTLVYVWVPFVALPIFAALERIDRTLLEAAADMGCRPWQAFLRVTLPLSMPGVAAGFFFALIPTIGEFVTPLLVGGTSGAMYGNLIQDQFMRALNWPMGAVMSMVLLALALVLVLIWIVTRFGAFADLAGA